MFVTRISLRGLSEDVKRKILGACDYCHENDKYGSFTFKVLEDGNTIYVYSPDKDLALKRGSYFHKKFTAHYNIIEEISKTSEKREFC